MNNKTNSYAARHGKRQDPKGVFGYGYGINNYAARYEPKCECPSSKYKDRAIVVGIFVICPIVVTSAIMTIVEYAF